MGTHTSDRHQTRQANWRPPAELLVEAKAAAGPGGLNEAVNDAVRESLLTRIFGRPGSAAPCAICNSSARIPGEPLTVADPDKPAFSQPIPGGIVRTITPTVELATCAACAPLLRAMTDSTGLSHELIVASHLLGVEPNKGVQHVVDGIEGNRFRERVDPKFTGTLVAYKMVGWDAHKTMVTERFAFVDLAELKAAYRKVVTPATHSSTGVPCSCCKTERQPVGRVWHNAPGGNYCASCYEFSVLETSAVSVLDLSLAEAVGLRARPGFAADHKVTRKKILPGPKPFSNIDLHGILAREQTRAGRDDPGFPSAVL